jgi:hypothetical protein
MLWLIYTVYLIIKYEKEITSSVVVVKKTVRILRQTWCSKKLEENFLSYK